MLVKRVPNTTTIEYLMSNISHVDLDLVERLLASGDSKLLEHAMEHITQAKRNATYVLAVVDDFLLGTMQPEMRLLAEEVRKKTLIVYQSAAFNELRAAYTDMTLSFSDLLHSVEPGISRLMLEAL